MQPCIYHTWPMPLEAGNHWSRHCYSSDLHLLWVPCWAALLLHCENRRSYATAVPSGLVHMYSSIYEGSVYSKHLWTFSKLLQCFLQALSNFLEAFIAHCSFSWEMLNTDANRSADCHFNQVASRLLTSFTKCWYFKKLQQSFPKAMEMLCKSLLYTLLLCKLKLVSTKPLPCVRAIFHTIKLMFWMFHSRAVQGDFPIHFLCLTDHITKCTALQ